MFKNFFGVNRTLKIDTGIPVSHNMIIPVEDIFLHTNFKILKDFVEIIFLNTHKHLLVDIDTTKLSKYQICTCLLESFIREEDEGPIRKFLHETYSLYVWYCEHRNMRVCPFAEASETTNTNLALHIISSKQKEYFDEDTKMLERLMRLRNQLVYEHGE